MMMIGNLFHLIYEIMRLKLNCFFALLVLLCLSGCEEFFDRFHDPKPRKTEVRDFVSGLNFPFGIEVDAKKQLWVTEVGTTAGNDGRLLLITPQGVVYPVVEGFSNLTGPEGNLEGLVHLALQDGILWILHGTEGRLYRFDVNDFSPGQAPFEASELEYEDIATFVHDYPFEEPLDHTHPYNLTVGPGGDLFIVDAGANAIIRRQVGTGTLSVFATFPDMPNPGAGPPMIDVVPTGIVYDGRRFLVSSLTGFPFLPGAAKIYLVDLAGNTSVYQGDFSLLTDIELGPNRLPLVTQFATFGEMGFNPNSGRLLLASGSRINPVLDLNFPTAIRKADTHAYYINGLADGKIKKVLYY
jgi:hypothetical protein